MSLNWNLQKNTGLTRDEDGHLVWTNATESLIFYTMSVGIGEITEKTEGEFYARVHMLETLWGIPADRQITQADVRQHRGLTTNVFPLETRAKWLKRLVGGDMDRVVSRFAENVETTKTAPIRVWPESKSADA